MDTAREALRQAMAAEHRLFLDGEKQAEQASRWQQRGDLAVRRGEDELARQAFERRRTHERRAAEYRAQYEAQAAAIRRAKLDLARPLAVAARTLPEDEVDRRLNRLAREDRLERELAALKERLAGR